MKTVKLVLLLAFCLPNLLTSWLIMLFIRAAWGQSMTMTQGVLLVRIKPDSWPKRTWWKNWAGWCAGHGIMLSPDADEITVKHELEHAVQVQVNSIAAIVWGISLGVSTHWSLGLIAVLVAPLIQYGAGSLVAWLHGGVPYADNAYERAARDATAHGENR